MVPKRESVTRKEKTNSPLNVTQKQVLLRNIQKSTEKARRTKLLALGKLREFWMKCVQQVLVRLNYWFGGEKLDVNVEREEKQLIWNRYAGENQAITKKNEKALNKIKTRKKYL